MEKRFLLVDAAVLPEVFVRVLQAKELLASRRARNISAAVKMAGLSRSAFYKYLMGQKLTKPEQAAFDTVVEKRTDAFSASTDVAAAIPTHTLEQVISKARTMGGLMAEARAFSMPSKIAIPIGTPSTKAAWHTEGAAVDTEKVTLSSVTFALIEKILIIS